MIAYDAVMLPPDAVHVRSSASNLASFVVTVVTAPAADTPDELDALKAQLARLQAGFDAMHAVMDRGTA